MAERKKKTDRNLPPFRVWAIGCLMVVAVAAGVVAFFRAERFFIRDPRFVLAGPPDPGQDLPNFKLRGVSKSSREQLLEVFDGDFGRSIYLMPLTARRASLMQIAWVRDASIYRRWPNQVVVEVLERQPVAFAEIPSTTLEGSPAYRSLLIDAEGVLLTPPRGVEYHLPVLMGIGLRDGQPVRRERVRHMLRLLNEAGELGNKLSEIDVADIHNLKVTQPLDNGVVTLLLGNQNFKIRLQNFFNHYSEILKRLPDATTLDMRIEDRITVVERRGKS